MARSRYWRTSSGNKFAVDDVQIVLPNTNQDVRDFIVAAKGQEFEQTSAGTPTLMTTGWVFHPEVQAVTTTSVWEATFAFCRAAEKSNLTQDSSDPRDWEFR